MPWTPAEIPNQGGRVAVVTGPTSGLGFVTVRELARAGARVVLIARNPDKAEATRRAVEAAAPGAALDVHIADLARLATVRDAAAAILASYDRIDVLVNNAGIMGVPEGRTTDGFELQLAINHLGHFVLTRALLPALLAAPAGRVVAVTSFARLIGVTVDPGNPHLHGRYNPWLAYGQSKLANLHFALELQRRLAAAGARACSLVANPGLAHTELQLGSVRATGGGLMQRFWHRTARTIGMSAERGAWPQLRAATDPGACGGELYSVRWGLAGDPVRRPLLGRPRSEVLARLWAVSERETETTFDVAAIAAGVQGGQPPSTA
jgi:NAD(P)-dependent dehydrogenase (short-subunit alcohol dehydrogenase family)